MKKLLLLSLFGLGVAATPALHAEKSFVQVQYPEQLFDGGRYVMAAVNNSDTYKTDGVMIPRVWYLNGTTAAAKSHTGANNAEFTDDMVWVFKADTSYPVCGKTGHAAQHGEGKVFHVGREIDGEMQYIVQCAGNNVSNGSLSSLALSATTNDLTATEFVMMPAHADFPDEQLFALSGGWTGRVFQGARVVSNEGKFDRMSNERDDDVFTPIQNQWSAAHRVFIELDSENIDNAVHYYWITKMRELAENWSADINDAAAAKELRNAILAIATPELEWDYATLETQVADYVSSEAFRSTFSNLVTTWATGKIVTFQNVAKGRYLCTSTTDGWSVGSKNEIGASSYWTIEQAEGGLKFKTTQGNYITANLGIDTNADNAALLTIRIYDLTNKKFWVNRVSDLSTYLHSNGADAASTNAVWATGNGDISSWRINIADIASRFDAMADEVAAAIARITNFKNAGVFTDEEFSAATAALNAIDVTVPSDLTTAETKLAAIAEQIASTEAAAWAGLDNGLFMAHNNRQDSYLTVVDNNSLQALTATVNAPAIWQLKHVDGEHFKLYNPSTGSYIASNTATTNNADEAIVFTLEIFQNTRVLFRNIALTENNNKYLHKSNGNNGLIWYTNTDAASAFNFIRGASNIISTYASTTSVPKVGTTFLSRVAATQFPALYNDVQEMLNKTTDETYNAVASTFNGIDAAVEAMGNYGFYVTLTPLSPDNTNGYKLHYTDSRQHNTDKVVIFDDNTETEANAIWMYKNGKFLNYSNGYHMELGKNAKDNFLGFCNSPADNNGGVVKIYNGHQDETAVQLVFGSNRNVHFHNYTSNSATHFAANMCSKDGTQGETHHNIQVDVVTELPIEIPQDGYATFSSPLAVKFLDATVDVYTKVITNPADKKFKFAQMSNHETTVIAPNTPVILHSTPGTTIYATIDYDYSPAAAAAALAEEQEEDSVEALTIDSSAQVATAHTATEGYTTYVKDNSPSFDDSLNVPFVKVNDGDTLPVNAMLLTVNNQNTTLDKDNAGNAIVSLGKEYTTEIEQIELVKTDGTTVIFDLMGRRLSEPVKGINIINGKKVLVK